jgi:Fe-S cluster biogenesis protein NfuA
LPDTAAREAARGLVHALLDLHALGLRRLLELCGESVERIAGDPLAGSLLLLHQLHPHPPLERLRRALEQARPRFETLGGTVEVVRATEEEVHLRLSGNPDASAALQACAAELLLQHVPDVVNVEFEEAWDRVSLPVVPPGQRS